MNSSGCPCISGNYTLSDGNVFSPMATDPCTKGTYYTSIESGSGQVWDVAGTCAFPCDYFPPDPGFGATSANSGLMVFVPCGDSSAPPIYTECVNQYVGTSGGVNAFQFCGGVNTQVDSSTCIWTNDTYDGTSPTYPALANTYVMCCSGDLNVNVYNNDSLNSPLTVTVVVGGTGTTNTVSASTVWSGQFAVSSGDLVYINGPFAGTYTANTISGTVAFAGSGPVPTPTPTLAGCINDNVGTLDFALTRLSSPDDGFSFSVLQPAPTSGGPIISGGIGGCFGTAVNWPAFGSGNQYTVVFQADGEQQKFAMPALNYTLYVNNPNAQVNYIACDNFVQDFIGSGLGMLSGTFQGAYLMDGSTNISLYILSGSAVTYPLSLQVWFEA